MGIKEFKGDYHFLSNFYSMPVTFEGITYRNNEAAFQAMKCKDISKRIEFSDLNPSAAKKKGRRVELREDWEEVKTNIMYEIVKAKFYQSIVLKELLLQTGNTYLEEGNTWGDRVWGTVNGQGENRLGKILMEVRRELQIYN